MTGKNYSGIFMAENLNRATVDEYVEPIHRNAHGRGICYYEASV